MFPTVGNMETEGDVYSVMSRTVGNMRTLAMATRGDAISDDD